MVLSSTSTVLKKVPFTVSRVDDDYLAACFRVLRALWKRVVVQSQPCSTMFGVSTRTSTKDRIPSPESQWFVTLSTRRRIEIHLINQTVSSRKHGALLLPRVGSCTARLAGLLSLITVHAHGPPFVHSAMQPSTEFGDEASKTELGVQPFHLKELTSAPNPE